VRHRPPPAFIESRPHHVGQPRRGHREARRERDVLINQPTPSANTVRDLRTDTSEAALVDGVRRYAEKQPALRVVGEPLAAEELDTRDDRRKISRQQSDTCGVDSLDRFLG
jgi:hypothetical protein